MRPTSFLAPASGGGSTGDGLTVATTAASGTLGRKTYTTVTAGGATNQALPAAPQVGDRCEVKNQGAGIVTVTDPNIFDAGPAVVGTYIINPGGFNSFRWDGAAWDVS